LTTTTAATIATQSPEEATVQQQYETILRELLERLANARELVDVNIAAGVASQQFDELATD
jgi:hypothetical protein